MYKISFYVPPSHAETVKNAMFAQGAGKIGFYECAAWQTLGEGQFKPLPGSNAFVGEIDQVTKIPELKIEMVCEKKFLQAVITALKTSHPYEEPAYQIIKLEII